MANSYLIETDEFLCVQLSISNIQAILNMLNNTNYNKYDFAYHDKYFEELEDDNSDNNYSTLVMNIYRGDDCIEVNDGNYIVLANDSIHIFEDINSVFSYYEECSASVLKGGSTEEKLKEIEYKKFYGRASEYKTFYTDFPYASSFDDFVERAKNGYSQKDWYNFYDYFATVMISMAEKFKTENTGVPMIASVTNSYNYENEVFMHHNEVLWRNKMDTVIEGFSMVKHYDELSNDEKVQAKEKLDKAFDVIKEHYFDLWD